MTTWMATATVPFPVHMEALGGMPADGSLPTQLTPVSRIPVQKSRAGAVTITVSPHQDHSLPIQPGVEYAALVLCAEAESAEDALTLVHPVLELVLDDLSFQLQTGFQVVQLEILDVTQPVSAGDEREMLLYPFPQGYAQWKFSRSSALGTDSVAIVPSLQSDYDALGSRTQQALDWYIKGLHAAVDADRFIFFWIALEVLEKDNHDQIVDTYTAVCGHEIPACPTCDRSTARRVSGKSLQHFLAAVGVTDAAARRLWKMRMIVHGAKTFEPHQMTDLGELLQVLRSAVVVLLKDRLGLHPDQPPLIGYGGPALGGFALGGSRVIEDHDLNRALAVVGEAREG